MILRRVGRQCCRIFKNGLSSVSPKYLLRLQADKIGGNSRRRLFHWRHRSGHECGVTIWKRIPDLWFELVVYHMLIYEKIPKSCDKAWGGEEGRELAVQCPIH